MVNPEAFGASLPQAECGLEGVAGTRLFCPFYVGDFSLSFPFLFLSVGYFLLEFFFSCSFPCLWLIFLLAFSLIFLLKAFKDFFFVCLLKLLLVDR